MARKPREPLVEAPPPAASSSSSSSSDQQQLSDDDEDLSSSDEPQQLPQPTHSSSSSPSSEEDEPQQSPPKKTPTHKKPTPTPSSDTDSPPPPPNPKPIESKPITSPLKKHPRSKPPTTPAPAPPPVTVLASPAITSTNKRRGTGPDKGTTPKKPKKAENNNNNNNNNVEGGEDGSKKPLFQRLWSEDDEVVVLEGMIEYKGKNGVDPMADTDNFLEFIKKSLHVDVNKAQFMSKVRTLKKRFENAKKKKKIGDPHGVRLFELSKKIWENETVKSNGGGELKESKESSLKRKKAKAKDGRRDVVNGAVSEDEKMDEVEDEEEEEEEEKLQDWVISRREEKELKVDDLGNCGFMKDGFLKEGMSLLDGEEKVRLVEKCRKHNLEEMELYVKRLDLLKELTQKTLNAMKSA